MCENTKKESYLRNVGLDMFNLLRKLCNPRATYAMEIEKCTDDFTCKHFQIKSRILHGALWLNCLNKMTKTIITTYMHFNLSKLTGLRKLITAYLESLRVQ